VERASGPPAGDAARRPPVFEDHWDRTAVLRAPIPAPCPPSIRSAGDLRCGACSSCSRPVPG